MGPIKKLRKTTNTDALCIHNNIKTDIQEASKVRCNKGPHVQDFLPSYFHTYLIKINIYLIFN
jgi:hypothetical protein